MNPIAAYVGIGLTVFFAGANLAFWAITKFNDLAHLEKNVAEIKQDVKTLLEHSNQLENRIVKMETKCTERHKRNRAKL